jgi:hypothetical protein
MTMQLTTGDWTEIFKSGDYGAKGSYSDEDLDKMVANFNTSDQVPIVVGHPATDAPAWGWLTEVKRAGSVLMAKVGELHKDFAQALAENKFRNRSVRIARTATGPKLLHLGFLGAVLPQVEGLKASTQFAGDGDLVDYGFDLAEKRPGDKPKEGDMEKDEQIKKLEADLAAEKAARAKEKAAGEEAEKKMRQAEFAAFVDSELIAKGIIPTAGKDEVVAFMASLPIGQAADFSVAIDGATKTYNPVDWFKGFIKALPTAEFTRELPAGETKDFSRTDPTRKLVDLSHKV